MGRNNETHGNALEARVPEGLEKQLLPKRISVLEISDRLVPPEVTNPPRDVLYRQRDCPYTVIRISVKSRILAAPHRVVFDSVLVRRLGITVFR